MATLLTTSYKLLASVNSSTYSIFRLYGKYNSQNTPNNKSSISLQTRIYGNDGDGSFASGTSKINSTSKSLGNTSYQKGKETILQTLTYEVEHSSTGLYENKTVTANLTTSAKPKGNISTQISLPKINRIATVTNAPNFNDEENPTFTFSNPANFNVRPYINFYDDNNKLLYTLYRNDFITSPYTWEITDEERTEIRTLTNKQKSYRANIGVETYNGANYIASSSVEKRMNYINAEPTQETTFTELNEKIINILGNSADIIVQNASNLKLSSIPNVKKEANVTKIEFQHNDINVIDTISPYEYIFTPVNSAFKVTINDSRGYSIATDYTKNIIEYLPIEITTFSFKRIEPTSSDLVLNAEIRYKQTTFGQNTNIPNIQWKCGTDGEIQTLTTSDYSIDTINNKIIIKNLLLSNVLDYKKEDRLYLYANDLLTEDAENEIVIKGIPTFDCGEHDLKVNGDLFIADEDGENEVNVLEKIKNLESGDIDLSDYATKKDLENYAKNTDLSTVAKTGRYYDLLDEPTKISSFENDKGYITGYTETDPSVPSHVKNIKSSDITNWNNKSNFSGNYNDLTNKPDLTGLETKTDASAKLTEAKKYTDTKIGDLIGSAPETLDTIYEVAQAIEENEDVIDALNESIGKKANASDLSKVATSGSYNDLSNKPTNISAFNNDKGYLTSIPSEYVTDSELNAKGYLTSFTEQDPTVPAYVKAIKESDIANWNTKGLPQLTSPVRLYTTPTGVYKLPANCVIQYDGASGDDTFTIADESVLIIQTTTSNYKTFIAMAGISSNYKPSIYTGIIYGTLGIYSQFDFDDYVTETELSNKGYLTSYTETDPLFKASASYGITSTNISNWNSKQEKLVSGTNIKTINGTTVLGTGNINIPSGEDGVGIDTITNYYLASDVGSTGDTITWDGDTTDKEVIDFGDAIFYKVSDKEIAIEEMVGKTVTIYASDGSGMDYVLTANDLVPFDDGWIYVLFQQEMPIMMLISGNENQSTNGVYFIKMVNGSLVMYISSLSLGGSGISIDTEGWTETPQTMTSTKKYLWNYERITYTDNTSFTSEPHIIGVYGDTGPQGETGATGPQGPQGEQGPKGDTGVGISTVKQTTTSSADGGTNVITVTKTDGTTSTFSVKNGSKGSAGKDGTNGTNGTNGKDGVSCTHSWNGTTLSVTSASGTSSANLKGEKGDKGDTGETGPAGKDAKVYYGTCTTSAGTQAKVVTSNGFVLETGAKISVKFTNAQTYNGTATLNVNSTGAKNITRVGTTTTTRYYWSAGEVIDFVYDGTNYVMEGKGTATTTYYGVTKLATSAVSTSTSTALTPASLNSAMQHIVTGYAPYSSSSTYAVGDRVRYSNYIYECITAITTAEAWTSGHWKQVDNLQTQINNKQDALVSGNNIKTINGQSVLGSGNITISSSGNVVATDVQVNGTSITSNGVANLVTQSAYNSSTNKIATTNDIPTNNNQLTNGAGYIKGINKSDVTTALGYTPYNSTNPNGYTSNTGTITGVSANGTSIATSGVANIPPATTTRYGVTLLSNSTSSTSNAYAATPSAVKSAYDLANTANTQATTNATAITKKQDELVSGSNIKTINGTSILGSGNISIHSEEINNANLLFDTSKRITFTPTSGTSYANYGGCYYYKIGTKVHVNVGISGITANQNYTIFKLPEGYRPNHIVTNRGVSVNLTSHSAIQVNADGSILVHATSTYVSAQIEFDAVQ